ncbi:glucuronate isomerase : Uronate isomerase OS=uncultured Acidobacteria bacterium A2 PE=4 SV=1: UxaC [Gemmataceae bacterium]|nr:glucuronate isomerase : Uronate isomerase OS=uncultured Acidobacteria bacterium A2 PE=4 SV=1: UxaC [Gemmataceae bacterium]VTT98017.1 glucuronate isomerase : Uronate isomerase OS=uncultured Acidobacteria bacterium A2 PE=4 SV=1: UxaC [Gemmataceae bacterium]
MTADTLVADLTSALSNVPLIDPHSHIDPLAPVSKSLDDILGYHYYTELAHSAGMSQAPLGKDVPARERVRAIVSHMDRYDNTAQYGWFLDIARTFLGFTGTRVTAADADKLFDAAEKTFGQADWEKQVFAKTKLEKIFLTNEFDDPLEGFDTETYVPCLRTDTLVFHLDKPETRRRLLACTGIEVTDAASLRKALAKLFLHFTRKGAKACAISLPPSFHPVPFDDEHFYEQMQFHDFHDLAPGVFWMIAEFCREFRLPFDLMIGVNRRVYEKGVFQGQDLFDQRTSLIHYKELFNAFPEVTFPVSVLTSAQNQELVAYSWIFPNVLPSGHWWYSNTPPYIRKDVTERLTAVPKTKLIGYYSDAYKLEFVLPKYGMYRRLLAGVLADEFVRPGLLSEADAVALGTRLLRDNVREVFKV